MLDVIIEGTTYKLPESAEELTLRKYISLAKIDEPNKTKNSAMVLATLLGCDLGLILNCDINQFSELCGRIAFIADIESGVKLKDSVEIDGVKYIVKSDFNKISVGMMSDIELISENKNSVDTFPLVISTLMKEEQAPYKTTEEKSELVLDKMNIKDALAVVLFFSRGVTGYMRNINSSSKARRKQVEKKKQPQEKSG